MSWLLTRTKIYLAIALLTSQLFIAVAGFGTGGGWIVAMVAGEMWLLLSMLQHHGRLKSHSLVSNNRKHSGIEFATNRLTPGVGVWGIVVACCLVLLVRTAEFQSNSSAPPAPAAHELRAPMSRTSAQSPLVPPSAPSAPLPLASAAPPNLLEGARLANPQVPAPPATTDAAGLLPPAAPSVAALNARPRRPPRSRPAPLDKPASWIGLHVEPVSGEVASELGLGGPAGLLVTSVDGGGPAVKAGIRPRDVVLAFNGAVLSGPGSLTRALQAASIGDAATIEIWRDRRLMTLRVETRQAPARK